MDKDILKIAKKIEENGGKLYLVGGAVRDKIMGNISSDNDYCVTGLSSDEFLKLFIDAKKVGSNFPVFIYNNEEYALARTEIKVSKGHKGFDMVTSKNITIEEDLKRRDLTINAIAKDLITGKIIDPFNGINDIRNKVIRHVSNSFKEDPLRVYRAARFAAKYGYKINKETIMLMNELKLELSSLSRERIFLELSKALETDKPSIFFESLKEAKVLDVHFKEIYDLIGIPQPVKYHKEGDVFNHTMIVLDKVSKVSKDVKVRFAALVHDFGKGATPKEILPHHYDHDIKGVEIVNEFCERLGLPNKWRKIGIETSRYHMLAGNCLKMRPYKLAKFFSQIDKTLVGIQNLEIIEQADDMLSRKGTKFADLAYETLKSINGNSLINEGVTPKLVGNKEFAHLLNERRARYIKENINKYIL